ncbi:MAG TPA: outer membrane beta-barrel protein, partial [Flavisolibacter sp.]|nr:outer membrane beta-barrel protein [Flavisolibacter sp.]
LTGITNNSDGKTLNNKLKEDKKKGAFGKAYAGTDFNKYYDGKALYNKFVGKKKLSAYVTKSNVNTGSLDWQDRQKLGIEDDMEYDEIGGFYYSFGSSDEFSNWNLQGLPQSTSAGALYSNKWNEDKQGLNGSYTYNRLSTTNQSSNLVQQILENTVNYRNKYTNSNALNEKHSVNGKYEWKIDSLASLKFTTADLYKTNSLFGNTYSEYLNAEKQFINNSNQSVNNSTNRTQSDNQLTYKQLFKKKDRLWLTSARFGYTKDDQNQVLVTRTNFYKENQLDSTDLLDQMKIIYGESKTLGLKTTYSEPLSPKSSLIIEYAYNQNNSTSDRSTYNKSNNDKYDEFDPLYSNNFDLKAYSNSGTAIFKFTDNKLRFSAGSGASSVKLRLFDKDRNNQTSYTFNKLTPQAQIGYAFKPQTRLSISYRGTTIQPNINQLQPILNNNDPLDVFVGNPDLKLGFRHSISAFFNQYKVLKQTGIWLNASYNATNNDIVNSISLDTAKGKQQYKPVNVNGNQNWWLWTSWHKGEGEKKLGVGLQFNGNGGRNISFLNEKRNVTNYYTINFRPSINYDFGGEKGSFDLGPNIGYNGSVSSLQPDLKNNYFSYGGNLNAFKSLPWKMEINTELTVNLQQKIRGFSQSPDIIIWNANLTKKVFKDKSGKIILSANDILDKNKGFDRSISSNYISENRYSRISRYFLLKFEWSFNKMPGTK